MATTIKTKNSVTTTVVPTSLAQGELAVNIADKKMWVGNAATTPVQILGAGVTNDAGGSNTQVQYNSSGLLAGSANFTFNGTTVTIANDASISGLTVGKGGGAVSTNTVVGASALTTASAGQRITAVGGSALASSTGNDNAGFGYQALNVNTSGVANTALGTYASGLNTTGSYNTSVGDAALYNNTTASNNTAVGYQAGYSGTTSAENSYFGYKAGYSVTTGGGGNCFFGGYAGYTASTGANNIAVGDSALYSLTTASDNTAVGGLAMFYNTTGTSNVAVGRSALFSNTTASQNTAVGYQAGYANTASENTFYGYGAGQNTTSGTAVTYLGRLAGRDATTASNNTVAGHNAGLLLTTGSQNTIFGKDAAYNLTTGNYNTHIGYNTAGSSASVVGEIVIHASGGSTGKGGNTGFINPNGGGVYQGNNSTLWSITSDQRLKKNIVDNNVGLEKITQIKVRNFEYRLPEEITELEKSSAINIKGVQLGPIAQELKEVLPDCVKTESTGVMSVDASNLTWYLVNAIKELKAEIDQLKGK